MLGDGRTASAQLLLDGQTATLGKSADGMPCPGTKEGLDQLISAMSKNDRYGMAQAMMDSKGVFLKRGWRVRAIGHKGWLGETIQLRIESGPEAGRACWEPSDIKGFFVNVR